jgi:hypothetical protein
MSVSTLLTPNSLNLYCSSLRLPLGNFQPSMSAGGTEILLNPNTSTCKYQVIGDFCFMSMRLRPTDKNGASGELRVALPVPPASDRINETYVLNSVQNYITTDGRKLNGYIQSGVDYAVFLYQDTAFESRTLQVSDMVDPPANINNTVLELTGFYRI